MINTPFIESGDEETEGESCKTKHVKGKKVNTKYKEYKEMLDWISYSITQMDFHHR